MQIITRDEWGARHRDGFEHAPIPARELYLHHSVTIAPDLVPPWDDDDAAIRTLERIGQERFRGGISYTHAVTPVGRVYEGTGAGRMGAHTGGRNSISHAIVLVGNYDTDRPPDAMLDAVAELVAHGHARGWWPAQLTGGHRDAPGASTACPGRFAQALIPVINHRALQGGAMSWDSPPIPDYWRNRDTGQPAIPNPAVALGWATAHAAHAAAYAKGALDRGEDANRQLDEVLARLDVIEQRLVSTPSGAELRAELADAVASIGPFHLTPKETA